MNGKRCKAAAPTGIAAANVEIEGTNVSAATIHTLFDLDTEFKSKLDFAQLSNTRVADLMALDVLLLDEAPILNIFKKRSNHDTRTLPRGFDDGCRLLGDHRRAAVCR